jgi:hypothetical protein
MIRKIILAYPTLWAVLYSNSKIREMDSALIRLPIPSYFRIVELIPLLVLFAFALLQRADEFGRQIKSLIIWFFLISLIGILFAETFSIYQLQDLAVYLAPLLFFYICYDFGIDGESFALFIKFQSTVLVVNLLVVLFYQIPFYWVTLADKVMGLYADAHILGTYLSIYSIGFLYSFLATGKVRHFLVSISLFMISLFPSNEKVLLFHMLYFSIVVLFSFNKSAVNRKIFFALLILTIIPFIVNYDKLEEYYNIFEVVRLYVYDRGIENIGIVQAWPLAFQYISESFHTLLFGLGAGNYAGVAASRAFANGINSKLISDFQMELSGLYGGAFEYKTNVWTNLLAQFGVIGFVIYMVVILKVINIFRGKNLSSNVSVYRNTALYAFLVIVFQSFFTPFTFGDPVYVYPLVFFATYLLRKTTAPVSIGIAKNFDSAPASAIGFSM